jgi:outer membrane protein assembly factor BamB
MKHTITLLFILSVSVIFANDWPWHSGPAHDFHVKGVKLSRDWKANPPPLLWKQSMTDNGHACASVFNDTLFIADHEGSNDIVRAFNLTDGQEKWRYPYSDTTREKQGFTRAAPTCYKGFIYTVSIVGNVHCLEQATGKMQWRKNYFDDFGGVSPNHGFSGPAGVWEDLVFLQPGGTNGNTVALHYLTGALVWRSGNSEKVGYSLPIVKMIDGKPTLLCYSANTMMGLNPRTGAILWTHPRTHKFGNNVIQPVIDGNRIITGATDYAGTTRFEVADGKTRELWVNNEIHPVFATPIPFKNLLFGTTSDLPARPEGLFCINLETGKTLWKKKAFEHGQLLRVGDDILIMDGQSGALVMFEPSEKEFREITRFTPLGGKNAWSDYFLIGDRLIVRNLQTLACFRMPMAQE